MKSNVIATSVLLIMVSGCAFGQRARDQTLLPAIMTASSAIEADALRGVEEMPDGSQVSAGMALSDFMIALKSEVVPADIMDLWPAVAAICEIGYEARIAAGEISNGVADSFRERVTQFGLALAKYVGGK